MQITSTVCPKIRPPGAARESPCPSGVDRLPCGMTTDRRSGGAGRKRPAPGAFLPVVRRHTRGWRRTMPRNFLAGLTLLTLTALLLSGCTRPAESPPREGNDPRNVQPPVIPVDDETKKREEIQTALRKAKDLAARGKYNEAIFVLEEAQKAHNAAE